MFNNVQKKFWLLALCSLSLTVFGAQDVEPAQSSDMIAGVRNYLATMPAYRTKDLTPVSVVPEQLKKAVSVFEMQGWRNEAEDAVDILVRNEWVAFGLFDGHGGKHVAKALVAPNATTRILSELLDFVTTTGVVDDAQIAAAYAQVDARLEQLSSGSTAIVCLINLATKECFFINLGDSRAVALKKNGSCIATVDHSPDTPEELARIEAAGGKVKFKGCWRVDGRLAVSRSFGDFDCKPLVDGKRQYHVGIVPEITRFKLNDVKTIVLACDGVWDVIQNEQVAGLLSVGAKVKSYSSAEFLCKAACWLGSGDNISALVIDVVQLLALKPGPGEAANQASTGEQLQAIA